MSNDSISQCHAALTTAGVSLVRSDGSIRPLLERIAILADERNRARAEGLEEAAAEAEKRAAWMETSPESERGAKEALDLLAKDLRIDVPAPATIPVERVRDEARLMLGSRTLISEPVKAVHSMLERLGVDLDATSTCGECGLAGAHKLQCGRRHG